IHSLGPYLFDNHVIDCRSFASCSDMLNMVHTLAEQLPDLIISEDFQARMQEYLREQVPHAYMRSFLEVKFKIITVISRFFDLTSIHETQARGRKPAILEHDYQAMLTELQNLKAELDEFYSKPRADMQTALDNLLHDYIQ